MNTNENNNNITIFETTPEQFKTAFENLVTGRTPHNEIKQRDGRGGAKQNYVNTYYMTEQISLLTGFRWSSECLEEKAIPNWDKPRELGAKMKVIIWDKQGNQYSHTSWGQKDVAVFTTKRDKAGKVLNPDQAGLPLSIFDDLKAAYSDGIKKCLSYFGIARDIYGGKELEFFADDSSNSDPNQTQSDNSMDEFDRYINSKGLTYDKVFEILNIKNISEITDYKQAYLKVKEYLEKGGK